ncbi:MAG: Rrf2 family transcriptional regulator [Bacteriodetes bacterium]|nr:Rrf2 family transcriptional regulator [Bacteroidota bacterium]
MLSKTCTYGLQAAIYIAAQPKGQLVSIQTIAENLNISYHFLTKVLQQLTAAGIMTSQRGVNGGVMLAKPAEEITLFDVVSTIDGSDLFTQCMLGLPGCGTAEPCPVHDQWNKLRNQIGLVFTKTTLGALADNANRLNLRLAHPELISVLHI